jgi:hypothetical protein
MQDDPFMQSDEPSEESPSWDTFVQNPVRLEARQITGETEHVEIGSKRLPVKPGDWVVRFPSGIKKRYRDEQFRELFSFVGQSQSNGDRLSDSGPPGLSV